MWPNTLANAILVPVAGVYIARRDPGVTEWITEVNAHPGGFGFMVVRHWWSQADDPLPASDPLVDLASADLGEIESSDVWDVPPSGAAGDPSAAEEPQESWSGSAAGMTVVRGILPPFEVTVTLPCGRLEAISEPMSVDEYVGRWNSPDHMLSTNNPAGTLRSGYNRYGDVDEQGALTSWEHHEATVTIWCGQLPADGQVTVMVRFGEEEARAVEISGADIRAAAQSSVPLFHYESQ